MRGKAAALAAGALLLAACDAADPPPGRQPAGNGAALAAPATPAAVDPGLPALSGRVVDRAELLAPGDEASLSSELAELERRTSDQLVIVTMPSLDGRSIEEFALALGNQWGIGQADRDNGVLIVVAAAERAARIEVGYGLEPILTDERAQQIVDRDLVPNFREGRWSRGLRSGARAIIATLIEHEHQLRQGAR